MKKNDRVEIFNRTAGGRVVHEGTAVVVAVISDDRARVRFPDSRQTFERWIDWAGQENPSEHVAQLNRSLGFQD